MSDERPDEFFSWRSRLNPPDALPEQGLDNRSLTWEKLAPRLQPPRRQPPHRRLPVYRIAAACLLLLLIPAALLFNNHQTHTARPPAPPAPLTLQPAEASPILQSGPTPKELAKLRPLHIDDISSKTLPAQPTNHTLSQQTPEAKPQDSLLQPPSTYADLVPAPEPPQNKLKTKQLKIVHVNELDNPANSAPAMTSTRSREPDLRALILLKNH